jgi:type II secretory ATPase GspE/PulE/Tfp pilus assembly ATPase PilB-like protein
MSKPSQPERRRAVRWRPALRVVATLMADGKPIQLGLSDFSSSGAALAWTPALTLGQTLELTIQLGNVELPLLASVARVDREQGQIGIAWTGRSVPLALDARCLRVDPAWALKLPASLALRRRVLPLCKLGDEVAVAVSEPLDEATRATIERILEAPVRPQLVESESLQAMLRKIHAEARSAAASSGEDDDAVKILQDLLRAAALRLASDLHLDPERGSLRVRLRVDGVLEDYRRLPSRIAPELTSRIKVLAGMDIAEKRAPQDGRFTHDPGTGASFELRVATLPTKHGERVALRLLALDERTFELESLGLEAAELARVLEAVRKPHGLVLVTGPTGCGKSTTLQAALRRILAERPVNAIAVQDPIEYDMPGVAQVEVDTAHKVTFPKALRSILRHDPDVILIGEIRDAETLDIALKAALTGHLVLATLHTNSAASAVTRLVDMGADRFLVAATLRMVVAQRLVRRLCPHCRVPGNAEENQLRALGVAPHVRPQRAAGCVCCAGRGYQGRIGLFELLPLSTETSALLASGADEARLESMCVRTLRADAQDKLASGVASLDDLAWALAGA